MEKYKIKKWLTIGFSLFVGLLLMALSFLLVQQNISPVRADPIEPPDGYPKLSLSTVTVTPTLAGTGGATLTYVMELQNTGAYTAVSASLDNPIPLNTTYNNDAQSSSGNPPTVSSNVLHWTGDIGFDGVVFITYSVDVLAAFEGRIHNTAVLTHPLIAQPVTMTAETVVTNDPILSLQKSAEPAVPGPNQLLTYTLMVANDGQTAVNLPIVLTDRVPLNTTIASIGSGGISNTAGTLITWTNNITLALGEEITFTFSVLIDDVISGTEIVNDDYAVASSAGITVGQPYTSTVLDPIFLLQKTTWPDPPGSNREMTYTLSLLNQGSRATDLVITDHVPLSVTYVQGGSYANGVVSWTLPTLDTNESATFTYTVYISDVADILIINDQYEVCSGEGICAPGQVLTSVVGGPNFALTAVLDPIAKKPGGGGGPVTPTLMVENIGPGNAIDAQASLYFGRISVSANDLYAIPAGVGTPPPYPDGPLCGDQCVSYVWTGPLNVGDVISFTTIEGQSTIGGEEGTNYTATIVVTDSLSNITTEPISATANGRITHFSNLIPTKDAPAVIGAGHLMTYTIDVWNSALATDLPPHLTDTVPLSTTLVDISDDGVSLTVGDSTVVSWTLPNMGPGDRLSRWFTVQVDSDLVSGTQIVNDDYRTSWYEVNAGAIYSHTGQPVTTTVYEVGLIDSYKVVTPTLALPGEGIVLTYYVHIVNSSPVDLNGVSVYDWLPWENTTYQRNAVINSGQLVSDIVSIAWTGDIPALSERVMTFTVVVDDWYEGAITNTAVITHPNLLRPVTIEAVAYITDDPVLQIHKTASPDPVEPGEELLYTIHVTNLGQKATNLFITDTIPVNTTYVPNSASGGGQLVGDEIQWEQLVLEAGESTDFTFRVVVGNGSPVITNAFYGVTSAEGVSARGLPVMTEVARSYIYLPIVSKP